jgi:type IX secretion system PorP/SprF family membrane protein
MKNKILLISLIAILACISNIKAQELANYNLYIQNNYLYNPAYTLDKPNFSAFANSHLQWVGFEDAPRVNTFGIRGPIMKNTGIGLTISNNANGVANEFAIKVNYAFRAKFADDHYLQFGTGLGFMKDNLSGINEFSDLSDNLITDEAFNGASFLAGVGMVYFFKNIEAQFIMPQIYHRKAINYYSIGILAYNYEISQDWFVKPSVLVRGNKTTPFQYDINIMGMWQKTVWAQAGYRTNNSIIFGLGVNYLGFELGYAYQMDNNEMSNVSGGTHEIQLIYNLKDNLFKKKEK